VPSAAISAGSSLTVTAPFTASSAGILWQATNGSQTTLAGQGLTFAANNPVILPDGLINSASSLTVDLTFQTTAGGVLLGYQNQPRGTAPSSYVPALYVGTDGHLYAELYDGAIQPLQSAVQVNDGRVHHVVFTLSGYTQTLTLDGTVVGTLTGANIPLDMVFNQLGTGYTGFWPGGNGGVDPFNGTIGQIVISTNGQTAYSAQNLVFRPTSPVTLPDGLIQNAMALTVDVTFHTTAGGVILGYQDAPGGNVPGNYVPALYVGTDGKLYGSVYSLGAVHSNTVVNDGLSHHAVLSVVGSTLSLTLDGVLLGQTTGSLSPLNMKFDQLGTGYTVNYPAGVNGSADPFIGTLEKVLITTNGAPAASETVPSGSTTQALQLNGTNQYVDLGNPADLNFRGPITLEAWIKPMSRGGLQDIITHGYQTSPYQAEVYLRIANGTYQVGSWNGTDSSATATMPTSDLGQWVHLAGVYDGTHWQLYRNGVLVASSAPTPQGALLVSSTDWAIGARGTGTERFFQGSIADVSIWRVGRSAAQVQADMRSGLTGTEAGLAAYYRFAETNSVTATDASGNNNNGMLGGANPAQAPTRLAGTVLGGTALAFSPTTAGTYAVSIQRRFPRSLCCHTEGPRLRIFCDRSHAGVTG
jgi:hypothetical protein